MQKHLIFIGLLLIISVGWSTQGFSQVSSYFFDFGEGSALTVSGTSTLHDWTIDVEKFGGAPAVLNNGFVAGESVPEFYFFAEVASMESHRGSIMNNKTVAALKGTEYPKIEYTQMEVAKVIAATKSSDPNAKCVILSKGNLEVGGVSRAVELEIEVVEGENGSLILKGQEDITYSQFEIEPPSAMFGQIVCGQELAIVFSLVLNLASGN